MNEKGEPAERRAAGGRARDQPDGGADRPSGASDGRNEASVGVRFVLVDYADTRQAGDLSALLDDYARDPSGGGHPLSAYAREHLVAALAATPNAFSILGYAADVPVALANCFVTLSTFAARPLVNVHDLAVASGRRGEGVGRALIAAIEREARARGACKITLEVLEGNGVARRAYERAGFRPYALDAAMGTALFLQRTLE